MFFIQELVGKNIILLDSAKSLGEIKHFAYNNSQQQLVAVTEFGSYKLQQLFKNSDVLTVVDALPMESDTDSLLDMPMYNTKGEHLGNVKDIRIDNNCNMKKLISCNETAFSCTKVYRIGDNILIKSSLPKNKVAEQQQTKPATTTIKTKYNNKQNVKINRKYGDFSFLLGRRCKKTICNFQGEIMIKRDSVITKEVLQQAKISGKLIELTLNS